MISKVPKVKVFTVWTEFSFIWKLYVIIRTYIWKSTPTGIGCPSMKHRYNLPLTEACLFETIRLGTVVGMVTPHMTICDTHVGMSWISFWYVYQMLHIECFWLTKTF
jgi:hypothetical protein